jgi:hypothetical protein
MTTGKLGTEKIQEAVQQIDQIFDDVQAARAEDSPGGKKITLGESLTLIVSDSGKVIRIVNSAGVIWDEITDLETVEAPEIIEAFEALYSPNNPYIKPGAIKTLEAIIAIKEAAEQFVLAKQWEKEQEG